MVNNDDACITAESENKTEFGSRVIERLRRVLMRLDALRLRPSLALYNFY